MGKRNKYENSTSNDSNIQNKQKYKRKSDVIAVTTTKEEAPLKEKRIKKNKNNIAENEAKPANKKIIFHDDVPVDVNLEKKVSSKSGAINKNSQSIPDDEAGVKDEDIDAFCEELDEEDNEQFDNWVKLIEEKLGSNKNKHK